MAGLLDFLSEKILPEGQRFQIPEWAPQVAGGLMAGINPATGVARSLMPGGYVNDLARVLGQQFVVNDPNFKPTDPKFAQGGGSGWGGSPADPASDAGAPQAPVAPAWAQSPAQAQQAFNMPTSSYQFGGQMVPTFGQAQPPSVPDEMTAQKRAQAPGAITPPQSQAPSYQSELLGSPAGGNKFLDFLDAVRPGFVDRYKSQQAQSETARGMYEIFRARGMSPNEAAAQAVIAARNPKVLEEIQKPHQTMEAAIASQYGGQGGGSATQRYAEFLRTKKAAESAGEKEGSAQAEAQIALPGAAADFQQTMQTIQELRNHKGRDSIGWHGPTANLPQDFLRGSEAYGAAKLEERLKSRVFGDQVKTMVGMGALSNAEGSKITDAVASLDRGLKKDEYNRTLDFIQTTIKNGMDKIATKAGQPAPFGWKGNDGWTNLPGNVRIRERQ